MSLFSKNRNSMDHIDPKLLKKATPRAQDIPVVATKTHDISALAGGKPTDMGQKTEVTQAGKLEFYKELFYQGAMTDTFVHPSKSTTITVLKGYGTLYSELNPDYPSIELVENSIFILEAGVQYKIEATSSLLISYVQEAGYHKKVLVAAETKRPVQAPSASNSNWRWPSKAVEQQKAMSGQTSTQVSQPKTVDDILPGGVVGVNPMPVNITEDYL